MDTESERWTRVGFVSEVVVITGLSGAGRSQAAAVLEDLGWYVVDNLPTSLIDTTHLNVHQCRDKRLGAFEGDAPVGRMQLAVQSCGFKYGLPLDADHVVDVRFLANPYWITELRHLTGRDAPVRDYVLSLPGAVTFIDRYVDALEPVLAGYLNEEKRYVTIAVGCTGGKHRSVAISEAIAARLRDRGHHVAVSARDLGKE